jgi:hypothetical protein
MGAGDLTSAMALDEVWALMEAPREPMARVPEAELARLRAIEAAARVVMADDRQMRSVHSHWEALYEALGVPRGTEAGLRERLTRAEATIARLVPVVQRQDAYIRGSLPSLPREWAERERLLVAFNALRDAAILGELALPDE